MVVLVCGSRNWHNRELIQHHLARISPSIVIHGGCSGADTISGIVAVEMGILVKVYLANWKSHGRAAGPIRNQKMLDDGKPDVVLAFHNNVDTSRGTKDMVKKAIKMGVPVQVISESNQL